MSQAKLDESTLRQLIREVIKEVIDQHDVTMSQPALTNAAVSHDLTPLTVTKISQYHQQGVKQILLTGRCAITPLAKAKARQLGLHIDYSNRSAK